MKSDVHLHLGIHKTATTFIQSTLRKNANLLERKFVKVLTPETLRPEFTDNVEFLATRGMEKDKLDYLQNYINELDNNKYRRIVISEENLIGNCAEPTIYGDVYKTAESRIDTLKLLFRNRRVKLFIGLRDYASYLTSAYLEVTRNRKFIMFDEYVNSIELSKLKWRKYIKFLMISFPESEIITWDYSKFKGRENIERIFDLLVGETVARDFEIEDRLMRKSISQKSVDILCAVRGILSHAEMKQLRIFLDCHFEENGVSSKFSPWTTGQENFLNEKYRKDLKEIANMKKVTLLFKNNGITL
jgi:hypothetical protein